MGKSKMRRITKIIYVDLAGMAFILYWLTVELSGERRLARLLLRKRRDRQVRPVE